jgi:hypothetical protein
VRALCLVLASLLSVSVAAQEAAPKKKKAPAKKQQAAHKKPTPEQIRKFNELQKNP